MSENRPLRGCDICGGVDTDPRHVFAYAVGDGATDPAVAATMLANVPEGDADTAAAIFAHTQDNSTTMRHMDCCAQAGCPDGTCDQVNPDRLTGPDLLAHLTKE